MKATCLCGLLYFLLVCLSQPNVMAQDFEEWLDAAESTVEAELGKFRELDDISSLSTAFKVLNSPRPGDPSTHPWKEIGQRFLRLQLRVLLTAQAGRDRSYDLDNPPRVFLKVPPPPVYGQVTIAGMDPELIKDPEAKRIYKERIAENEKNKAKYKREKVLQEIIDGSVHSVRIGLRWPGLGGSGREQAREQAREMVWESPPGGGWYH